MQATDTETDVAPAQLAAELLELWCQILKGSSRQLYALLGELDLSMTQMKLLHALNDHAAEVSVKEIGAEIGLSLPGASRAVDSLLRRDLVERREDPNDRRIKRVRITDEGIEVVTRIDNARLAGLETYTSGLTPAQRRRLSAALADLPHRS